MIKKKKSCECCRSELDLFALPETLTSIEESRLVKYYPINSLDQSGPIEFRLICGDEEYIDPSSIILFMQSVVLDGEGDKLNVS